MTLDLETLSLSVNAAILQIGVVVWDRNSKTDPILTDFPQFISNVDLRSCILDDFDIDVATIKWWRQQPNELKKEIFEAPAHPLPQVLASFCTWLEDLKNHYNVNTLYLWSQGSDFDIAILRNAFSHYNIPFPVDYRCFRDARTFILENECMGEASDHGAPEICQERKKKHHALHDALYTSRKVWSILKPA